VSPGEGNGVNGDVDGLVFSIFARLIAGGKVGGSFGSDSRGRFRVATARLLTEESGLVTSSSRSPFVSLLFLVPAVSNGWTTISDAGEVG
jgi:hypothetical protein